MYMHRFFNTIKEAREFRKNENDYCGAIYNYNSPSQRLDYLIELAMMEEISNKSDFAERYPFCVAWNEFKNKA